MTRTSYITISAPEKMILKSFVTIFEHFEIATDLLQGEHYASISMAIRSYLRIKQHLETLRGSSQHNLTIINALFKVYKNDLEISFRIFFTVSQLP